MKLIQFSKDINELSELFPEARLSILGSVLTLLDKNGDHFAEINLEGLSIIFYDDYQHYDKLEQRLNAKGISLFDREIAREVTRELLEAS